MSLSKNRKGLLAFILVATIIVMLFLAAEGITRARQYIKYGTATVSNNLYYDEESGLSIPVPNSRTKSVSINSLGFRGPEIEMPKPPDRLRIGFIGASTTFCAEVSSNKKVWADIVTNELMSHFPELSIDYVNGGVPGYSTETSLINLEKRVMPLHPDIVIIYHATNDLAGETRDLAEKAGLERINLEKEASWLGRYSLLWQLVEKNLALISLQSTPTANDILNFDPQKIGKDFKQNLEKLTDLAYKKGARLVVLVTFSIHLRDGMTADQENSAMVSARYYMPYISVPDYAASFKRYNQLIKEAAEDKGALLVGNENSIPGDLQHFTDSVHFTDAGSQLQADRIVSTLVNSDQFLQIIKSFREENSGKRTISSQDSE